VDLGLRGRSVIVTGSSRGLGRAMAGAFAAEGAHLTICARDGEELAATAAVLRTAFPGVQVATVAADVTSDEDAQRIVDTAVETHGRLDVLVNNAGASVRGDNAVANHRESLEINTISVVRLMELARPHLAASGIGSVVNISSIYGRESGGPAQYNASKAAQIALSKAYALEWASEGIRVNNVAPGSIRFEGGSWDRRVREDPQGMEAFVNQNIAAGRFGTAEEVAAAVVFLASPAASWIIGATLNVDGGQSRSNI
jgi:3-oxoacyl-[acyl-carrier protein] reductase